MRLSPAAVAYPIFEVFPNNLISISALRDAGDFISLASESPFLVSFAALAAVCLILAAVTACIIAAACGNGEKTSKGSVIFPQVASFNTTKSAHRFAFSVRKHRVTDAAADESYSPRRRKNGRSANTCSMHL